MFFSRRPPTLHRQLAVVRDVVEILAIVAAGIWAIYIFVYTDKIEPFQKPIAPVTDDSIVTIGEKSGLLAVQLKQSIQNPGPSTLFILGSMANILGSTIGESPNSRLRTFRGPREIVQQRTLNSRFEEAYVYANTRVLTLKAGETWKHQWIVYVPRHRYDALLYDSNWTFTRDAATLTPLPVALNLHGVHYFKWPAACGTSSRSRACPQSISSEIQVSLWGGSPR